MTVRCKFVCEDKNQNRNGFRLKLVPVVNGSSENETFFKWTPFGSLEIGTINDEAAALFTPGKEYYLDLTLAE